MVAMKVKAIMLLQQKIMSAVEKVIVFSVVDVDSITDWLEKSRTKNVRFYFFYYGSRQNVAHTILKPEYTISVDRKRTKNNTYAFRKSFYTYEIACV